MKNEESLDFKNDPRYVPRVQEITLEDGSVKIIRNLRADNRPNYARAAMESHISLRQMGRQVNAPNSRGTMSPFRKRRQGNTVVAIKQVRPFNLVLEKINIFIKEEELLTDKWVKAKTSPILTGIARTKDHIIKVYNHGLKRIQVIRTPYTNN